MFLVPCLKEKHSLPDALIAVIERKISVVSSSSIDSGISVQRDTGKEQQREELWSLRSSSSSLPPSIMNEVDENSTLSDYETDDENCENHANDCEKSDTRTILEENKLGCIGMVDLQSICYGSQFAFHIKRDDFLSAERETVV